MDNAEKRVLECIGDRRLPRSQISKETGLHYYRTEEILSNLLTRGEVEKVDIGRYQLFSRKK